MICEITGVRTIVGRSLSDSYRRTKRYFKANIHPYKVQINNSNIRLQLSSSVIRMIKKFGIEKVLNARSYQRTLSKNAKLLKDRISSIK